MATASLHIHFQNTPDRVTTREKITGEFVLFSLASVEQVKVEVFITCKEIVNFRILDRNNNRGSDKIESIDSKHSKEEFSYSQISEGEKIVVKFELKPLVDCPPSCYIEHLNDIGSITYNIQAVASYQDKEVTRIQKEISVIPDLTGNSDESHEIHLKKCCINYGTVSLTSKFEKKGWRLDDTISLNLEVNNSQSSARLTGISYELWKIVRLKDAQNNIENHSTIIYNSKDTLNIAFGKALMTRETLNKRINLKEIQENIGKSVSSASQFVFCKYELRFNVTANTFCGAVQGGFTREVILHH